VRRGFFCLKEEKKINFMEIMDRKQSVYPSEFLKYQQPLEEKYRFNVLHYQNHSCPNCGGNCNEFIED
jgi:hypothetical protein